VIAGPAMAAVPAVHGRMAERAYLVQEHCAVGGVVVHHQHQRVVALGLTTPSATGRPARMLMSLPLVFTRSGARSSTATSTRRSSRQP